VRQAFPFLINSNGARLMNWFDRMVVATMPLVPKFIVGKVASSYIAGERMDDAINTAHELNAKGFMATIDVLGEFVAERERAEASAAEYLKLLEQIAAHKLDANVSVKLTALGMDVDKQFVRENLSKVVNAANVQNTFLRIDMENSPYTDETLKIYTELRDTNKVGTVIQAYMRRSSEDIRKLMASGPTNIRLCKGIYNEAEAIAYKDRQEIRQNFLALLDQLFTGKAYVGIATHDDYLVTEAEKLISKHGITRTQYEFQMLLGVRHELRNQILSRGHRVRIYVPFGEAWYGYCTRRLKENPAIAGYVFKSIFTSK
jgi:proline dehydrogenase